mmetsp:Transcript_23010/g.35532  ORF Transcript_23010/g.35532 Transcript_23010/m.35532 type:complete len:147 (+) Transcript_23010:86-526(+)
MIELHRFLEVKLLHLSILFAMSSCNAAFLKASSSYPNINFKHSLIFASDSNQQEISDNNSAKQSQQERLARIRGGNYAYDAPEFSPSFQAFIEAAAPSQTSHDDEGVACVGEPSSDPSRSLQNLGGMDSEWMEDAIFKEEKEEETL